MPTIYAQLSSQEPIALEINSKNGQEIISAIKEQFAELKQTQLGDISFEGYKPYDLDDSFFAEHSQPDNPIIASESKIEKLQKSHSFFKLEIYLTGTPGVGKTTFLLFFINRLLQQGRTVIVGSQIWRGFYQFSSNKDSIFIEEDNIRQYCFDSNIFFVLDSRDIQQTLGPCLICSSPRADIAKQFRKTAKTLYMPVWEWSEVQSLHQQIYSDVISSDFLAARFYFLGGIPRFLFQLSYKNAVEIIKNAVLNSDPSHFKRLYESNGSSSYEDVSHRLIHQDSVFQQSLKYASSYAATLITEHYHQFRRDQVIQWLIETSDLGKAGGLHGNLFEEIGHMVLLRGESSYPLRCLEQNGGTINKFIPNKQLKVVAEKIDVIQSMVWDEQHYFKPMSKIFECIDSWMVIDGETWGFQFTTSRSHKISTAIYWLFKYMNLRHYVTVVYDQSKFNSYPKQKFTQSGKKPFSDIDQPEGFNVKQYVMIIDVNQCDFTNLWDLRKAEFITFVQKPWSANTMEEYYAAFEDQN